MRHHKLVVIIIVGIVDQVDRGGGRSASAAGIDWLSTDWTRVVLSHATMTQSKSRLMLRLWTSRHEQQQNNSLFGTVVNIGLHNHIQS